MNMNIGMMFSIVSVILLLVILRQGERQVQYRQAVVIHYEQRFLQKFPRERLPELLREMPRGFYVQSESHGDGSKFCDVILCKPVWSLM